MADYEVKELKAYKGYGIDKLYEIDSDGDRTKRAPFYNVYENDDYVGEEFETLKEAKKFIDGII